jgi:photosystem II stability/assembly factor-like uncharacterized protein
MPLTALSFPGGADLNAIDHSRGMGFAVLSPYEVFLSSDGISWRKAGPEGREDFFTALAVGPDYILVGSKSGRIYRSSDGRQWETLDAPRDPYARKVAPVFFLAISPDGKEVLASSGQGVVRSIDRGNSWEPVTDPFWKVQEARSIMCLGYAGKTAMVITRSGPYRWTKKGFVQTSKDLPEGVNPVSAVAERGKILIALPGAGIYETGNGRLWKRLSRAPDDPVAFVGFTSTGYLAAGPFSPLYVSDGKGQEWTRIEGISQAFVPMSSRVNNEGTLIVFHGKGLMRLKDGSLTSVEMPVSLASINALAEVPGGRLAGTQGGVFYSPEGSSLWQDVTPVSLGANVNAFLPLSDGRILLASGGLGVFVSGDGGKNWDEWNEGLGTANDARSLVEDHNGVLAATEKGLMRRSLKLDSSWEPAARGIGRVMISGLKKNKGFLWAATEKGVFKASLTGPFEPVAGFSGSATSLDVHDGSLLALVSGRILLRDPKGQVRELDRLPGSAVPRSMIMMDGVPAAGSDRGVFIWQGSRWNREGNSILPVDRIFFHAGVLTVVTRGGGTYNIR